MVFIKAEVFPFTVYVAFSCERDTYYRLCDVVCVEEKLKVVVVVVVSLSASLLLLLLCRPVIDVKK